MMKRNEEKKKTKKTYLIPAKDDNDVRTHHSFELSLMAQYLFFNAAFNFLNSTLSSRNIIIMNKQSQKAGRLWPLRRSLLFFAVFWLYVSKSKSAASQQQTGHTA